jgi:hypothetical protein
LPRLALPRLAFYPIGARVKEKEGFACLLAQGGGRQAPGVGNAKLGVEGGGFEELGFFLGPGLWGIGVCMAWEIPADGERWVGKRWWRWRLA